MFYSTSSAIGFWCAAAIVGIAAIATYFVTKKPKKKKGTNNKDAFLPHVDKEGDEWRRTLNAPPPWRR